MESLPEIDEIFVPETKEDSISLRNRRLIFNETRRLISEEDAEKRHSKKKSQSSRPKKNPYLADIKPFTQGEYRLSPVRHLNENYTPHLCETVPGRQNEQNDTTEGIPDNVDLPITTNDLLQDETNLGVPESLIEERPHPASFYPGPSFSKPITPLYRVNAWRLGRVSRLAGREIVPNNMRSVPPRLDKRPQTELGMGPNKAAKKMRSGTSMSTRDQMTASFTINQLAVPKKKKVPKAKEEESSLGYLPLDVFDDISEESRTPFEWIDLGPSQNQGATLGYSKWFTDTRGGFEWRKCFVIDYNELKEMFFVEFQHNGIRKEVSRLNLRFDEESQEEFDKRIENAKKRRARSELHVRYNARIDAMPTTRTPPLPMAHEQRILSRLGMEGAKRSVVRLVREVDSKYQRNVNKFVFDLKVANQEQLAKYRPCLPEPYPAEPKSRLRAMEVQVPPLHIALQSVEQKLPTANPLVYQALLVIWETMLKVRQRTAMSWDSKHPETLEAFDRAQNNRQTSFLHEIRSVYLPYFCSVIISAFHELSEEEREADFEAFKNLTQITNRMIQGALEVVIAHSLHQYSLKFRESFDGISGPVFQTLLLNEGAKLVFEPPLEDLEQLADECVMDLVDAVQTLPHLNVPLLDMDDDIYSTAYLPTIDPKDERIGEALDVIQDVFDEGADLPHEAVVLTFAKFHQVLLVDPDEYSEKIKEEERSKIAADIRSFRLLQEAVALEITDWMNVGVFSIDCSQVKAHLWRKYEKMLSIAYQRLSVDSFETMKELHVDFRAIVERLNQKPGSPEELVAMQEYRSELEARESELVGKVRDMIEKFEQLEELEIPSPEITDSESPDTLTRWDVFAMPAVVQGLDEAMDKEIQVLRVKLTSELRNNQRKQQALIADLAEEASSFDKCDDIEEAIEIGEKIDELNSRIQKASETWTLYNTHEGLFDMDETPNPVLSDLKNEFEPIYSLWTLASQWISSHNDWRGLPFNRLNPDHVESVIMASLKEMTRLKRVFRNQKQAPFEVSQKLHEQIDAFKTHMPLISRFRHPGIRQRHWKQLADYLGFSVDVFADFSLEFLLELHLENHQEVVSRITDVAVQEHSLESSLDKMQGELAVELLEFVRRTEWNAYLVRFSEDLFILLDDQQVLVQTMLSSPYCKPVEKNAIKWGQTLKHVQDVLEVLVSVQKLWAYLRPIFTVGDIEKQLPNEAKKYVLVDQAWVRTTDRGAKTPGVLEFCKKEGVLETLLECSQNLEAILAHLNDYLEAKRKAFPRFYFLSNEELLDILSKTSDPHAVQPHLRKCFENINRLEFTPEFDAVAMKSAEGEVVQLEKAVDARQPVEHWLEDVEKNMILTLRTRLPEAVTAYYKTEREEWLFSQPAQVIFTANQITYTSQVTKALQHRGGAVKNQFMALRDKIQTNLESAAKTVRGKISKLQRLTLGCLLVLEVHNRDILTDLIDHNVTDINDFEWQNQMRYYLENGVCTIRMVNVQFDYGYEYLGNMTRLVITPLTDRAYRTLLTSLHMNMGCSPMGPAGTGKTETTKDLAKAVAKQCVVFNCSDGLDYIAMAKFFKGLASCGAWCCLDEFNRIDIEVLSVVAAQIFQIQQAIQAEAESFIFEEAQLKLNPSCAVFVTMNPGYVGRSELPDNLKALFRPLAMVVPDYAFICEILLYAEGFELATSLSRKIVNCFRLASNILSDQSHYDFGMRTVKTVLSKAGKLKRANPDHPEEQILLEALRVANVPKLVEQDKSIFEGIMHDLFPEIEITAAPRPQLLQAIDDAIEERGLQASDAFIEKILQLFDSLSVRHGVVIIGPAGSFKTSVVNVLIDAISNLATDLVEGFVRVTPSIVNPKAVTLGQLFGYMNEISQEWMDGIIADIVRTAADEAQQEADSAAKATTLEEKIGKPHRWLVFDGPMDTLWVENLNSVLDDSRLLCLTNGERIKLPDTMRLLFEMDDISKASPATISRCGMVLLDEKTAAWRMPYQSWIEKLPPKLRHHENIFDKFVDNVIPGAVYLLKDKLPMPFSLSENVIVQQFLRLVSALLVRFRGENLKSLSRQGSSLSGMGSRASSKKEPEKEETVQEAVPHSLTVEKSDKKLKPSLSVDKSDKKRIMPSVSFDAKSALDSPPHPMLKHSASMASIDLRAEDLEELIEMVLMFAFVWSFGGSTDHVGRVYFDAYLRQCVNDLELRNPFPETGMVFDYRLHLKDRQWVSWTPNVPPVPGAVSVVRTRDTERAFYFLDLCIRNSLPVVLFGPSGVGKSLLSTEQLLKKMPETFIPVIMRLAPSITANNAQEAVEQRLERRRKGVFGPPVGKQLTVFVDDLHRPLKDESGAQPPLEFVRTFLDKGIWYAHNSTTHNVIVDVGVVGCMSTTGSSNVPPRLLRHFNVVQVPEPDDKILGDIALGLVSEVVNQYAPEIQDILGNAIQATVGIYRSVCDRLRPTPTKSHYTFNARNVLDVARGIVLAEPSRLEPRHFPRLWAHECCRVMRDRLVDASDRKWFDECLDNMGREHLGVGVWAMPKGMEAGELESRAEALVPLDTVMYGSVSDEPNTPYFEIESEAALQVTVQSMLQEYNGQTSAPMDIVLFHDTLAHLLRVVRALNMKDGHIMLVGVAAKEQENIAKLAAFIVDDRVMEVELTRAYGINDWHDNLRRVLKLAGVEGRGVVFLMRDAQIKMPRFLEDIESIVHTGDVPGLMEKEDMELILQNMQLLLGTQSVRRQREVLYDMFTNRVRENLHVCLLMNPLLSHYRGYMRAYPSLPACAIVDWFRPWPSTVLDLVGRDTLQAYIKKSKEYLLDGPVFEKALKMLAFMHEDAIERAKNMPFNYVAPTDYVYLLDVFKSLLSKRRTAVDDNVRRFENGVKKLASTSDQVTTMQGELELLVPELRKSNQRMEELLEDLNKKNKDLEVVKDAVKDEEMNARNDQEDAQKLFNEAEELLQKALPALHKAESAIANLSKKDLAEIRTMKHPPSKMVKVIEAICIMMGRKPKKRVLEKTIEYDYWPEAVPMLADVRFVQKLKSYDAQSMPEDIINKIQKYVKDPEFEPEAVERISHAAGHLCTWVHALEKFYWVNKEVTPKKKAQAEAAEKLKDTEKRLQAAKDRMKAVDDEVAAIQDKIRQADDDKTQITNKVRDTQRKVERAGRLLGALGGEATRWEESLQALSAKRGHLLGDVLISAGFCNYLGPYTPKMRKEVVSDWVEQLKKHEIPASENFALTDALVDDAVRVLMWHSAQLPSDMHSEENGVIILEGAKKWPLLIDPQGQANSWIKNMYKKEKLAITTLNDPKLTRTVENCVLFGQPLLIEDIGETIDPVLEPLLSQQIYEVDGRPMIMFADNAVMYNKDFKLFLSTRLSSPAYAPDLCAKVTLVNFSVTPKGLADQLLALVVQTEREDLEIQRQELIEENAKDKKDLKETEDTILSLLSEAKGDMLEDENLIDALGKSKEKSKEITDRLAAAEQTHVDINDARQAYYPVAKRASSLFFCVGDLAVVNPQVYQFSLDWFFRVFETAVSQSEQSEILDTRLENLVNTLTYTSFVQVCRSLFANDRIMFSFLMCIHILRAEGKIDPNEYHFLLTGKSAKVSRRSSISAPFPPQLQGTIDEIQWLDTVILSTSLPDFAELANDIQNNIVRWKRYMETMRSGGWSEMPSPWNELDQFKQLLIIRVLVQDALEQAIQRFIVNTLGPQFVEPPPGTLADSFKEGNPVLPMIYIVSPGTDPMEELTKFAEIEGVKGRFKAVSMGQGQGPVAAALIGEGLKQGNWVFLQNCHLIESWLPELERIVDDINRNMKDQCHKRFRLWLSTKPSQAFPVSVLQLGVKMVLEPPRGLRQNLLRIYEEMGEEQLEKRKDGSFQKLLFGLSFFHAVVQERGRFGPLGWTNTYEFGAADLEVSKRHLAEYLDTVARGAPPPFRALKYVIGEINYGGRVTDDMDRRILMSILETYINPQIRSSGYTFAKNRAYRPPERGNLDSYKNHIRKMPLVDEPDVFGLHPNATITTGRNDVRQMCETLLSVGGRADAAGAESSEALLNFINDIFEELPKQFDVAAASSKYPPEKSGMNQFLYQELQLYNKLLEVIVSTLKELTRALNGLSVMSGDLDSLAESLRKDNVSALWNQVGYLHTFSLDRWLKDLTMRCEYFGKWIESGEPSVHWIGAFFRPKSFLGMQLQRHARKSQVAVDRLRFVAKVLSGSTPTIPAADGVYVLGLSLEGARWNAGKGMIDDALPGELYGPLPTVHLLPQEMSGDRIEPIPPNHFRTPVYRTLLRSGKLNSTGQSANYLLDLDLPTDRPSVHWARRGTGMFVATE